MSARILIVEDELVVARGISEMLTRFGYAVVGTADRGEEAVDLAGRLAPDLILMDIVLAGTMDGVEAAREIRERFAVPVVYMTANADMGTVARARDTAPYGYVLKPVERLHLFSTIDTAVNKHALERRLVESERTARALLDASRDRAFLIGRDYVILGLNIVAAQAVGMRADEAIGRSILDLVPADLAASRKPHLDRALVTGMAVTFEDERGGVLLEHHIYPIRDERGATAQIAIFARDVTIERRAQEAIRKSEERYRRIVETAAEGVWSMDGDRVTTFVNRQMAEMLGRPAVDIVGKRVTDFMFPEDLAEHERRMEGRARGEGGRYEQRFRRADGSTLWCLVSATALAGDDGSFHGSFAMFTDITQRKQAEERLQNNQRILFSLLNATTDSAALLDVDGVTLMENDAFRLDFGDDYSVLIERAVPEAPQGPIVRGAVSRVEAVVATGRPVNFMLRRDNRHFDVTLYPIVDANRFVVNIALFAHDITTIVRAEQELRASEEKFRCLFEDSSDAQALLDRFAVVDCNGAAAQLLEYGGARDLVGKSLYDCSPEVQPDGIFSEAKGDLVSRRLAEEGSFRFEWELVRRGGSSFIVEVYATRIRLGSRTVVHAARGRVQAGYVDGPDGRAAVPFDDEEVHLVDAVARELGVTAERKIAEEELRAYQENLEDLVRRRTAELTEANRLLSAEIELRKATEDELREATLAAMAASRAKTEFLSNMSHELRTPLNSIIGFAKLMKMGYDPDDYGPNLDKIIFSGTHLLKVFNEILQISRIESGRFEIERKPVDLARIIAECGGMMEVQAAKRNIAISIDAAAAAGAQILGDEAKLQEVFINLLSNAVKFTDEGGRVAVRARTASGALEVDVSDTGVGISPEHAEYVFEKFARVETGLTRKTEGTGLGLSIARKIVEAHGGVITLKSAPGEGSTFTVRLPIAP